jgi:NADH:ubiquinone oxidoreductase subunit 2 (subunit N)
MIGLIVVAAIGSTISLYYYMRIIVRMFMMDSSPVLGALIKPVASKVTSGVVLVCAILIILFGTLLPESGMRVARHTSGEVTGGL